ncbi:MAG: hypothetical protein ACREDF_09560 [Thermoplasmata archaeon]
MERLEELPASMAPIIEARQSGAYRGPGLFTGDCDTYSAWVAALGGILGFNYAFETVKVDLERPDEFSHVYTALRVGGNWYPLDPSTRSATPGWRPPVDESLLQRWPEKPIEDVVGGKGMSGLNGFHRRNGLGNGEEGSGDENAYYPAEEYGYGIPKSFGPAWKPGFIPTADAANMQLLPPHDTEIPEADLKPGLKYIKASKGKNPSRRIVHIKGQPDDHGPPYYRSGNGSGRQPYIKVENQPYPPGSPWNGNLGRDVRRFWKAGPTVQEQHPGTPERQVRVVTEQPMAIRRRQVTIVQQPSRVPAGMGQEGEGWESSIVTSLDSEPAKTATSAGNSVLDTVTKALADAAKVAGAVVTARVENKYATAVAKATNTVAGANVASAQTVPVSRPSSIFLSPWFLGGTALALGAGIYIATRKRGGRRR